MAPKSFFFAGGGTGGHIYPALAVAQKLTQLAPDSRIHFFVSRRDIDSHVLSKTGFEYTTLPATGLSARPDKFLWFCKTFLSSCKIAADVLRQADEPVVIGVGGFVAAPVCRAAHRQDLPVVLINVDFVPGRANRLIAKLAGQIFVQFEETVDYFKKNRHKVRVTGCPLRKGFEDPQPERAKHLLGLYPDKKVLLITGASSGSQNINGAICSLLDKLSQYASDWQIVHLAGKANHQKVKADYANVSIRYKIIDYWDDMADLLAAADLVIGRSGAVSVAEYAAAGVPAVCVPYPYHKDLHQYLNAGKLVEAGAAVIVDDAGEQKQTGMWLWEELEPLLKNDRLRERMKQGCKSVAKKNAAHRIAEAILKD